MSRFYLAKIQISWIFTVSTAARQGGRQKIHFGVSSVGTSFQDTLPFRIKSLVIVLEPPKIYHSMVASLGTDIKIDM